jgi:hypothetical protein
MFLPDPEFQILIRIKVFLTPKTDGKFSKIRSGMFIPDPGSGFLFHPRSRIKGSKRLRIPDP